MKFTCTEFLSLSICKQINQADDHIGSYLVELTFSRGMFVVKFRTN